MHYFKIENRDIARFIIDGKEILVMIRNNKLMIEADRPVLIEPVMSNTFNIILD